MLLSWGIIWKIIFIVLLLLLLFLLLPNAFWLKIEWETAWSPAAKAKQIKLSYTVDCWLLTADWLMFCFCFSDQSSSCRARLVCCLLGINYQCLTSDFPTGWFLSRYLKMWRFQILRSLPVKMPESELNEIIDWYRKK